MMILPEEITAMFEITEIAKSLLEALEIECEPE